jgi:hypothetical protein
MTERLAATGSGFPTVFAGDQALHSRYNPPGEAEKYIKALELGEAVRFFILLEPGLGYGIAPLRRRFPGAKIIVLHVSDFFSRQVFPGLEESRADAEWNPGSGTDLQDFLEGEIPDTEASSIGIIEWRPSLAIYGTSYLRLLEETAEFIKRIDASRRTLKGFGRRWLRNAFRNAKILKRILSFSPGSLPVIVTGAGPSLEESIPLMVERKKRGPLFVLAASSSASALLAGGITPDLIISTDGGFWARLHFYGAIRQIPLPPLAAALTAVLPSQCSAAAVLPLCDGSLWQRLLLRELSIPFIALPQRGTVTASALDLAFSLTRGPVLLCGTDLAHRDLRTHARPYSLDRLQEESAGRLCPRYTRAFVRARDLAAGGSYAVYAGWFKKQLASYPKRLASLGSNNPVFPPDTGEDAGEGEAVRWTCSELPDGDRELRPLFSRALRSPETAETLRGELGPLLFPEKPYPSLEDLEEALLSAAGPGKIHE